MDRPKTVQWFFMLYLVSFGVAIAPTIRTIIVAPENYSRTVMVVTAVVMLILYAGLGYKIYLGKDWARYFLTVASILGSGFSLTDLGPHPNPAPIESIQWLQSAIMLLCVILLYLKPSRDWFESHRDSLSDRKRNAVTVILIGLSLMVVAGVVAKALAGSPQYLPAAPLLTLTGLVVFCIGIYRAFTKPKSFDALN